uniref:Uncharacterized protein n=1 Tax=viral metagenome TaxID=1070528 RepID=A0A6C0IZR5_9ZZZZ
MSSRRAQIELPYTKEEVLFYQRKYPQLRIRLDLDRETLRLKIREARRLDGRLASLRVD